MKLFTEIDTFICKEQTGPPTELAKKIQKSTSSIYRLLHVMKDAGAPIQYCKQTRTYRYAEKGHFIVGFVKEKQ